MREDTIKMAVRGLKGGEMEKEKEDEEEKEKERRRRYKRK